MLKVARGVKIVSDFVDYYDTESNAVDPLMIYVRNYSDSLPRGESLKFMRDIGVKTIQIGLPREFVGTHEKVVVYTDIRAHNSLGKIIVDSKLAADIYSNNLASPYYIESNGVTIKFLQVGTRRFRITFKNDKEELNEGTIESVEELEPALNRLVRKPVFSLDYIPNGKEMLCVDFNAVQHIGKLGLQKIMSGTEVIEEIKKALLAYNIK